MGGFVSGIRGEITMCENSPSSEDGLSLAPAVRVHLCVVLPVVGFRGGGDGVRLGEASARAPRGA